MPSNANRPGGPNQSAQGDPDEQLIGPRSFDGGDPRGPARDLADGCASWDFAKRLGVPVVSTAFLRRRCPNKRQMARTAPPTRPAKVPEQILKGRPLQRPVPPIWVGTPG